MNEIAEHIANCDLPEEQIIQLLTSLNNDYVPYLVDSFIKTQHIVPDIIEGVVDIVGTGGDGHNTINISTISAIVAASCGAKVAKHGSRSASSKSGSADVIDALGIKFTDSIDCLNKVGITFLYAPDWNPSLVKLGPIRKKLGVRTVINLIGPLLNPLRPKRMILGVYDPELIELFGSILLKMNVEHVLVVHCGGLDELATVDVCQVLEIKNTHSSSLCKRYTIDPFKEFGMKRSTIDDLKGSDAVHNSEIIHKILDGSIEKLNDCIQLNAGALLYVAGIADTISDGISMSKKSMNNKNSLMKLNEWIGYYKIN